MDYASLYDLIQSVCNGTRLHVGVLFFGKHGNRKLVLPHEQTIHSAPVCEKLKTAPNGGFEKCFRCRNAAITKALAQKQAFGGLCINGVYEYTHPVVEEGEVICVIYIGNILASGVWEKKLSRRLGEDVALKETMEPHFGERECAALANVLESYVRMLLSLYAEERETQALDLLIENMKRYITANLEYGVSISKLASIFHYNEKYLGRKFKQQTGVSFHEYIHQKRIARAEQLLRDGNESMIDISEKVGFNNVTYFNRIFKRFHGVSPAEFRKRVRAQSVQKSADMISQSQKG